MDSAENSAQISEAHMMMSRLRMLMMDTRLSMVDM